MTGWKALSLILTGLLILPLALAGCTTSEVSAREIAANVVLAYPAVDTYSMDMDFTMTMMIDTGPVQTQTEIAGDARVSIDLPAKEMKYNIDMLIKIPGQGTQNFTQNMYIYGGYMYMNISGMGVDQWTKIEFNEDLWASENQLKQQVEFLQNAMDITYMGEEIIDGVDCYILKVKPDMASIFNWGRSQLKDIFADLDSTRIDLGKMFKQISIKEWVTKDTSLPVKSEIQLTMEFNPQDVGAGADEFSSITAVMQGQAKYYGYGQPVTIELPQEALDAVLTSLS